MGNGLRKGTEVLRVSGLEEEQLRVILTPTNAVNSSQHPVPMMAYWTFSWGTPASSNTEEA